MATKTFELQIKLPKGSRQTIRIQADNHLKAKALAEMQYGKGPIIVCKEVRG